MIALCPAPQTHPLTADINLATPFIYVAFSHSLRQQQAVEKYLVHRRDSRCIGGLANR